MRHLNVVWDGPLTILRTPDNEPRRWKDVVRAFNVIRRDAPGEGAMSPTVRAAFAYTAVLYEPKRRAVA